MSTAPGVERPLIRDRRELLHELRDSPAWRRREWLERRRRERQEFGRRIQWEAAFFGLLTGLGTAVVLVAMVIGGLVAAGVTNFGDDAASIFGHLTVAGGAVAVAIVALGYLTAGYVAARMARFDGWRQGIGIWVLSLLIALAAAITAWVGGGQLDPTKSISLPSNPIGEGPLQSSIPVAVAILVVVPLLAAIAGGLLGERFHRAIDRLTVEDLTRRPSAVQPADEAETETESKTEVESEPEAEAEPETEHLAHWP
jgi:hypothetical protein